MTIFAACSETEGLDTVGAETSNVTTGAAVVSGVNRAAINLYNRNASTITLSSGLNEGWLHARIVPRQGSASSNLSNVDYILSIRDGSGNIVAGFYQNDNNSIGMDWWATYFGDPSIGTANTTTTGVFIGVPSGAYDVDLYFKISDTVGILRWYVNGSLIREVTGDTKPGSSTTIDSIRIAACGATGSAASQNSITVSQIFVSDLPTIGGRLHTLPLSAGSVNQWAGAVTDINAADETRTTFMSEDTTGEQVLFAAGDVASLNSGNKISAVVMSASAQSLTGSPVTKLRGRVRLSGTDYTIGSDKTLSTGFQPARLIADLNPATGLPWTLAEVNAMEIGFQALT